MNNPDIKIAAIVVTYNRLGLLKKCVSALRNQTRKLDEIIVVNNSSTDGTYEWLNEQTDLTIITQDNGGSAGGQFTGLLHAYKNRLDFFWCLDTDIVPEIKALELLLECAERLNEKFGFASSLMLDTSGDVAYPNIPELDSPYRIIDAMKRRSYLPIISASFGSVLFKKSTIRVVGLPKKEFFIWGDDAEFTLRIISKGFNGFLVPESRCIHIQENMNANPYTTLSSHDIKLKYGVRNMVSVILLRNLITHKSKLRGIVSAIMFTIRIIKGRRRREGKYLPTGLVGITGSFFQGLFFNPKTIYPEDFNNE